MVNKRGGSDVDVDESLRGANQIQVTLQIVIDKLTPEAMTLLGHCICNHNSINTLGTLKVGLCLTKFQTITQGALRVALFQ